MIRPILVLLAVVAGVAAGAGLLGHVLAVNGYVTLLEPMSSRVPVARHIPFITDLWAHSASYFAGAIGGCGLAWRVWRSRRSPAGNAEVA